MANSPWEYIWPGILAAQAIYSAAKLGVADLLGSGPKTVSELAAACGAHPPSLERLLRALATLQVFRTTSDGRFCNTALSETLRGDHPKSERPSALFLPSPFLWRPLGELYESVRTGKPAFQHTFGQRFFDYLAEQPNDARIFNAAMTQGVAWTTPALLAAYDFGKFRQLVDVGGGQGALLHDILSATPGLQGVLFDLPAVVAGASQVFTADTASRCRVMSGNFFESVPSGADAYLMKGVIHDWPDDDAGAILRNTRRAMRPDGTLLLVEGVLDPAGRSAGLMDLLMLVIGGRERTEADLRSLLASAGFSLTRIIPAGVLSLIESHLV